MTPIPSHKKSSLASKAGIMVVSRGITIASQLATLMFLTRLLTKETFGVLTFLLLAYTSVLALAQLGLPESIFYFFERIGEKSKKSLAFLTSRTLFLAGVGASGILVALNFLAPLWGFDVNGLFFFLIILILMELPISPLPNLLIAIDKAKAAAWFNILTGLIQFASLVAPAVLGLPLQQIVICLVFYGIARFFIGAFLFFKNFKGPADALSKDMMKEQLKYSIPLAISQILWGLNRQIDKYIVAAFLPVVVYAEYTVGAWEIPFIPAIAYTVASVMMPQFVSFHLEGKTSDLLDLWNRSIRKVTIIVLPLVVLFILIADEFIALIFSEKYIAAAIPFRIYTLIILQRVAAYSSILKALGETKVITYSAIYLILINVILSIPFVLWLGMAGPPLATLLANLFTWGYILYKIKDCLHVSLVQIFPFPFYFKTLATAVFIAIPMFFLKTKLVASHSIKLGVIVGFFVVAYGILSTIIGLVKKEDWNYFLQAIKLKRK